MSSRTHAPLSPSFPNDCRFHVVSDVHLETRPLLGEMLEHTQWWREAMDGGHADEKDTTLPPHGSEAKTLAGEPPRSVDTYVGFVPCADASRTVLLLVGDICPIAWRHGRLLRAYLHAVRSLYRLVLYVPGNHEYYLRNVDLRAADPDASTPTYPDIASLHTSLRRYIAERMPNVVLLDGGSEAWCPCPAVAAAGTTEDEQDDARTTPSPPRRGVYDLVPGIVRVLGTTLWSHVPAQAVADVQTGLMDYDAIHWHARWTAPPVSAVTSAASQSAAHEPKEAADGEPAPPASFVASQKRARQLRRTRITCDDTNRWHAACCDFLERELVRARDVDQIPFVVVLTHHAPLNRGTSAPMYERIQDRAINYAFATDLSQRLFTPFSATKTNGTPGPLCAWLFGHTHWPCLFRFSTNATDTEGDSGGDSGVWVGSNPVGYRHEQLAPTWSGCILSVSSIAEEDAARDAVVLSEGKDWIDLDVMRLMSL